MSKRSTKKKSSISPSRQAKATRPGLRSRKASGSDGVQSRRPGDAATIERGTAVTVDDMREAALLGMSTVDAAAYLEITDEAFLKLFTDPSMVDAWRAGRRTLESSLHGALLKEAMNGKVAAIRLALQRLDLMRDDHIPLLGRASTLRESADDQDVDAAAAGPAPLSFANAFRDLLRSKKEGTAG